MKDRFHEGDKNMSNEYWNLKRTCYACVCITPEYNGSCMIWNTYEEAWQDTVERTEGFVLEDDRFYYKEVPDGFEILDVNGRIVRCYKVFETQELE